MKPPRADARGGFIATGQAPYHSELAKDLGLSVEEGRKLLHELMEAPCPAYAGGTYPGWLYPGTDYIASFPVLAQDSAEWRATAE